ncbi:MAG: hypothetical protein QXO76_11375, partial [Thermoproteota archaeon]
MTGILGIYLFDEKWNAGSFGIYGLMALQHRGQETAGIELIGQARRRVFGKGLVEDVLSHLGAEGHICLGAVSPYPVEAEEDVQPLAFNEKVTVALDGRVTRVEGYSWDASLSYEGNLRKAFASFAGPRGEIETVKEFFDNCRGGFAYIAVNHRME